MIYRFIAITVCSIIGGGFGFMVSDRQLLTIVHNLKANPAVAAPGDVVRMEYQASRIRPCETHVERLLFAPYREVNDQRFVLTPLDFAWGTLPVGPDTFSVPVTIPKTALPGRAMYRTINCYVCNPTHRLFPVCDAARDIFFEIRPAPD